MHLPDLQTAVKAPIAKNASASFHDTFFVARLEESAADQAETLDSYSFNITPRIVSPLSYRVGRKKVVVDPSRGRMLLTYPPFEVLVSAAAERAHSISHAEPYYVVSAKAARLQALGAEVYGKASLPFPLKPRPFSGPTLSLMDRFLLEYQSAREDSETALESLETLILIDLFRTCFGMGIASPARYPGIRKAARFVRENFDSDLPVSLLAEVAGLTKYHFIVVFRDVTGYTPGAYLRAVRIREAAKLLREGRDVTTTCFRVGFRSLSAFEQAFARAYRSSPKAYQKAYGRRSVRDTP